MSFGQADSFCLSKTKKVPPKKSCHQNPFRANELFSDLEFVAVADDGVDGGSLSVPKDF